MNRKTPLTKSFFILGFGVLAVSTASVFIKMCAAPASTIAAWRLGLASLFYYAVARKTSGPLRRLYSKSQLVLSLFSGLALVLHFIAWITSLRYTSVASSVVLVSTSPIWVAIGGFIFLREKPGKLLLSGIAVTLIGSVVISGSDFYFDRQRLIGNALAVLGALFAAVYLLIGRRLRAGIDTLPYVAVVYTAAAIVAFAFILLTGTPFYGFDARTTLLLVAIAVFPQVIGHTSFNWALKYFSASAVAVVTLGEPIGASTLAWIFLGEKISFVQFAGGVIILA